MGTLLVRGGRVVGSSSIETADVLIDGERIAAVGPVLDAPGASVIDASGCYVLPGGIDAHVHFALPVGGGLVSGDDWESGSRAALAGGTTTVIDFVTPERSGSLKEALEARKAEAAASCCDWSLHLSVTGPKHLEELPSLLETSGCPSVKVYMAYRETIGVDNRTLLEVMSASAKSGGTVLAHCEDGEAIGYLRDLFFSLGKTLPRFHPKSRPPFAESGAIRQALRYAALTGARLYVVHVSTGEGARVIANAKAAGQPVFAEVCLHHLLLDESVMDNDSYETAKYVMSPPLRPAQDVKRLWHFLTEWSIDTVSSDHCPFDFEGPKQMGRGDFRRIPNGVAGVQERLPLFLAASVAEERISWQALAAFTAENPAKIFGLYPRKGVIREGSDADLVIWNPSLSGHWSKDDSVSKCDYTVYEGRRTAGRPCLVISRGEVVAEDCKVTAESGRGKFVTRVPEEEQGF